MAYRLNIIVGGHSPGTIKLPGFSGS